MNRSVVGIASVAAGGTVASGGAYLVYGLTKGSYDALVDETSSVTDQDATLSETLTDFESKTKEQGCLKTLFPDLDDSGSNETTNVDNTFFHASNKSEGCLIVNWDKKTKTENQSTKWSATFRFLWATKVDSRGFMVFLAAKTSDESGKHELKWEGSVYTTESSVTGQKTTWKFKKQQCVKTESATLSSGTDALQKFPQPGSILRGASSKSPVPKFWGLMSGDGDLANIVPSTTSGLNSPTSLKAYWQWYGEDENWTTKMHEWTQNLDTWWKWLFDEAKFKAKDLADMRKGLWTRKFWKNGPKP